MKQVKKINNGFFQGAFINPTAMQEEHVYFVIYEMLVVELIR